MQVETALLPLFSEYLFKLQWYTQEAYKNRKSWWAKTSFYPLNSKYKERKNFVHNSLFFNSKFHAWRNACIKKIFSINIVLIWVEMSPIIYSYVIYDEFSSLKICLECWEKKSLYFYALRSLYLISSELYMTHFIIHCA